MGNSDVIDLTGLSSPEVSPLPKNLMPNARQQKPASPLHYKPQSPTRSGGSPLLDTSFLRQARPPAQQQQQQPVHRRPTYNPANEDFLGLTTVDPDDAEWQPSQQQQPTTTAPAARRAPRATAATAAAATNNNTHKPKRTREQIAAEAAAKKVAKERETALRKQQRDYDSDKHVLKYLTAHIDPNLFTTSIGIKIAEEFNKTQSLAEHERITYKATPSGLEKYHAIKWTRQIPLDNNNNTEDEESQQQQQQYYQYQDNADGLLRFEERQEPHIMICFEAEAFVDAIEADGLQSLWQQLTNKCSGQRVHIMVLRLDGYLTQRERGEFRQNMRAGDGSRGFRRQHIDAFVAALAVQRPGVTFRDVRLADEAGVHACLVTRIVAKSILKKNDAEAYLKSRGNKKSDNTQSLLTNHPIENPTTRIFMNALCTLPPVGPQIAHPIAIRFKSLGSLGAYILDGQLSAVEKQKELEYISRIGAARAMKVGPKASRMLVGMLMSEDPDLLIYDI